LRAVVCDSRSIIGIRKAKVLPVPVWAVARTSLPAIPWGIAWAWTGVGVVKFAAASLCCMAAEGGISEKWVNSILLLSEGRLARRNWKEAIRDLA
jgi:hypothetical protein